ncbi:MAG: sulfatase-like hydrolase/transferase [Planctomycetes bacterium]|nr:sulfatase-like hydrolase/transferase [Planctomycetota bacterium]
MWREKLRPACLVLVWSVAVAVPEIVFRPWSSLGGLLPALALALGAAASLALWFVFARRVARVRARRPAAAWAVLVLFSIVVPLLVAGTSRYRALLSADPRAGAVAFFLRWPDYGGTLVTEATGQAFLATVVASSVFLFVALALLARPLPGPPGAPGAEEERNWRKILPGLVALVWFLASLAVPSLPLSADLHGVRTAILGVIEFLRTPGGLPEPERVAVPSGKPARAPCVVLLLHESLGADPGTPRTEAFLKGRPGTTVLFSRAVSAAGATDVSVPSLLSGIAPDASRSDFARAPLLWHEARALGYRTGLFSAQDFRWANFESFFLGPDGPDEWRTAASFAGEPRVNDGGVDDALAIQAAIDFVLATPAGRPCFVVVQFNATHWPGWWPEQSSVARSPAEYVDSLAVRLLHVLAEAGRLDDAVVVSTADHGFDPTPGALAPFESFSERVLRVPLLVHFGPGLTDLGGPLAGNSGALVSNLDVYPTLLDIWGRWPLPAGTDRPALAGLCLLAPVSPDRVHVSLSTGALRSWPVEGFAVHRGRFKLRVEESGAALFDLAEDPGEERDLLGGAATEDLDPLLAEVAARPALHAILERVDPGLARRTRALGD